MYIMYIYIYVCVRVRVNIFICIYCNTHDRIKSYKHFPTRHCVFSNMRLLVLVTAEYTHHQAFLRGWVLQLRKLESDKKSQTGTEKWPQAPPKR